MVKNIIFDFGGVIYNIDHLKTKEAFLKLGIKDFDELYGHAVQTQLFEDFEIGKISPVVFRNTIREHLPENTSDKKIDQAWNALLVGFVTERLELLEKVGKHYCTFLLSNTNQIHYQQYMRELKMQNRFRNFLAAFDKLYFSHQVGMRKPDERIFNFLIQDNLIKAEETVFIDDYDINISAANSVGLRGLWLKPGQDLFDIFTQDGYLID